MGEPKQARILVVDDEESVRTVCSRMLKPLGYTVQTAANGEEALAHFKEQPFDLLITDFQMPGVYTGLALARLIKERFPQTQIILITAFPAVDMALQKLRLR